MADHGIPNASIDASTNFVLVLIIASGCLSLKSVSKQVNISEELDLIHRHNYF